MLGAFAAMVTMGSMMGGDLSDGSWWTTMRFNHPVSSVKNWVESLPVGNGRMGAMPFGGVGKERILINEDSVWAGPPVPEQPLNSAEVVNEARALYFAGKIVEAEAKMREAIAPRISPRSYQPVGWLTLDYDGGGLSRIALSNWEVLIGDAWVKKDLISIQVEPGAEVKMRCRIELSADLVGKLDRLTLSPVDDKGVVSINGVRVGETGSWSESSEFTVGSLLKAGWNELEVLVRNVGGVGHGPKEVFLEESGAIDGYVRELDLREGVSRYRVPGGVRQEVVASAVDDVIVVRLENLDPESGVKLGFETDNGEVELVDDGLVVRGQARHGDQHLGVKYALVAGVDYKGGSYRDGQIFGTREAVIYVSIKTDYNSLEPGAPKEIDLESEAKVPMTLAMAKGWGAVRNDAVTDHLELFGRCRLQLGTDEEANERGKISLDQRIKEYQAGVTDFGLETLLFEYGRYLLIASSREGSLPANLQGIWNPHMDAPWNSDYHTNINLQMNYWPACVTGLAELQRPFFDWLEMAAWSGGKQMAERLGSGGFAMAHTSDVWGWSAMTGEPLWGAWVLGGAWSTAHMMEQYRYTGDEVFLEDEVWPMLKGSAEFFLDWLVEDPVSKKLVSGPVTSPENQYVIDGKRVAVAMGPTMDQMVIWENFTNVIEAATILGIDDEFVKSVRKARDQLRMPEVGKDGRLMEWDQERVEAEPGHRHISHVYGLHPGYQITSRDNELFAAIRKSLEFRLANGGGHTGWSRAWIINIWARLMDEDKAYENVQALLRKSIIGALMDNHPPFQIDGNFGFTAGVAEMLMQSHEVTEDGLNVIRLWPATPKAWSNLEVQGLRARGGAVVNLSIADGVRSVVLSSDRECTVWVVMGDAEIKSGRKVTLRTGSVIKIEG